MQALIEASWIAHRWSLAIVCVAFSVLGVVLSRGHRRAIHLAFGALTLSIIEVSAVLAPDLGGWPVPLSRALHSLTLLAWIWSLRRQKSPSAQPALAGALFAIAIIMVGLPQLPVSEGPVAQPWSGLVLLIFAGGFAKAFPLARQRNSHISLAVALDAGIQAIAQFVFLFTPADSPWTLVGWGVVAVGYGGLVLGALAASTQKSAHAHAADIQRALAESSARIAELEHALRVQIEAAAGQAKPATEGAPLADKLRQERDALLTQVDGQKALLALLPDALIKVDPDQQIVEARVERTLLAQCALEGRAVIEALTTARVSEQHVEHVRVAMRRAQVTGEATLEMPLSLEGRPRRVEVRIVSDGNRGWAGLVRDITEQWQADLALKTHTRRLEQSNQDLTDFAAVITHDLQAPVRKIRAFGELLRGPASKHLDEEAQDYLERMHQSADRVVQLLRDLHSLSLISTDAQPFAPVPLEHVAEEVATDVGRSLREAQGTIHIERLPVVEAEPRQMRLLIQALVDNAIKFRHPERPLRVQISGKVDSGGRWASVTVTDNGVGFDPRQGERIFKLFTQLRGVEEGTGLGLAICRRIMAHHGGALTADSIEGQGSRFTFRLPVRQQMLSRMLSGESTPVESPPSGL
ncbi:MAG: sensor histidine kinase [Bradymonadia bacterium]